MRGWFDYYGVEEKYYKKYGLELTEIKKKSQKVTKGLNLYFA